MLVPGSDEFVITSGGGGLTVRDMLRVAVVAFASVTCTVKEVVPATVGVPEMAPAEVSARPEGNAPDATVQVYGAVPPMAARLAL